MKKTLLHWTAAIGIVTAVSLSSCTYDTAYTSVSGSYSSGYGYGYGYGGSGFSTSVFVSTGDPRWGYDPYTYCYYDYRSRRYYDPYLYGYYPIGYRPPVLIGVPHPYGWRPGRGYCPPPRVVKNVTVVNYRNRESSYRRIDQNWARNVRTKDYSRDSHRGRAPEPRQNTRDIDRRTRDVDGRTRDVDQRTRAGGQSSTRDRGWPNSGNRGFENQVQQSQYPDSGRSPRRDVRPPASYQTPVDASDRGVMSVAPPNRDSRDRQRFERGQGSRPEFNAPAPSTQRGDSGFRNPRMRDRDQPQSRPQPEVVPQPEMAPPTRGGSRDPESPRGNQEERRGLRSLGDG
jgi:hypothetical protein